MFFTASRKQLCVPPVEHLGTLLRYPYEVRDEKEYFDEIQDVKVTKDMLDLAKHIVTQKTADFEPEKFEDHHEAALAELINAKRNGKTVGPKPRPKGDNVVDLMEALKRSIGNEAQATKGKKPRKATAGQKEMLLPISGKLAAKQDAKKSDKPATARTRKRAYVAVSPDPYPYLYESVKMAVSWSTAGKIVATTSAKRSATETVRS